MLCHLLQNPMIGGKRKILQENKNTIKKIHKVPMTPSLPFDPVEVIISSMDPHVRLNLIFHYGTYGNDLRTGEFTYCFIIDTSKHPRDIVNQLVGCGSRLSEWVLRSVNKQGRRLNVTVGVCTKRDQPHVILISFGLT